MIQFNARGVRQGMTASWSIGLAVAMAVGVGTVWLLRHLIPG